MKFFLALRPTLIEERRRFYIRRFSLREKFVYLSIFSFYLSVLLFSVIAENVQLFSLRRHTITFILISLYLGLRWSVHCYFWHIPLLLFANILKYFALFVSQWYLRPQMYHFLPLISVALSHYHFLMCDCSLSLLISCDYIVNEIFLSLFPTKSEYLVGYFSLRCCKFPTKI